MPFSLAVISAVGSKEEACSDFNSHPAPVGLDPASLESWCVAFLMQGLSLSTHRTSAKAQCSSGVLSAPGQAPPVRITVWNLCLFAIFLTQSIHHRNIKVYLSCIRGLHVEQRFADPLKNNLCLQQGNLGGIKQSQGLSSSTRSPITDSIYHNVDLAVLKHGLPGSLHVLDSLYSWLF